MSSEADRTFQEQRPALAKAPLVPMQSLELKARDGLTLVSYLSLPPGADTNGDGRPAWTRSARRTSAATPWSSWSTPAGRRAAR